MIRPRICLIASELATGQSSRQENFDGVLNGTSRLCHELATHLKRQGNDVVVLTDRQNPKDTVLAREYEMQSLGQQFSLTNSSLLEKRLREIAPDLAHFHGGEMMSHYAQLANASAICPTVITSTFVISLYRKTLPFSNRFALSMLSRLKRRGNWKSFDKIIVSTNTAREDLIQNENVPTEKISIIPYGVSDEYLRTTSEPHNSNDVIAISGIEQRRGFDTFLSAIPFVKARVPSARFMVSVRNQSEAKAYANDRHPDVSVLGPAPLHESVKSHSIIVAPYHRHVAIDPPLSVVECMALGKAVITTGIGSIPELMGEDRGLIVPAGNAMALADSICEVALDPTLQRAVALRAMRYVRDVYDWKKAIDATTSLYESVLA